MSILRSLERRGADPTLAWGNSAIPTNGQMLGGAAGVAMNDDVAMSITTVGTCVALIADGISTLPFVALDRRSESKKLIKGVSLIENPWPEGSRIDFFTQMMYSLLLRGNSYNLVIDRDSAGYATALMPVHPDRVTVRRNLNTGAREYRIGGKLYPTGDVFHIPSNLLPPGALCGLNPVEYQRLSWALAKSAETYGANFFNNSANPSGIISVDSDLSEDETLEMARAWKMSHGGVGNAQYPAVLTGGAKWTQVSLSPDDAQFIATRQLTQQMIISWFRVPPYKIGAVEFRSYGPAMTEELEMSYVTDSLLPWARRIEDYFTLITRPSVGAEFDFSGRLRGNTLMRAQAAQIWMNTGMKTADECRAYENLEPLANDLGAIIARPMNNSYFSTITGELLNVPDPLLAPPNSGGVDNGGGDPAGSPNPTAPASQ